MESKQLPLVCFTEDLLLQMFNQEFVSGASGRRLAYRCKRQLTSEDIQAVHARHRGSRSTLWSVSAADCWSAGWPQQSGNVLQSGSFLQYVIHLQLFVSKYKNTQRTTRCPELPK